MKNEARRIGEIVRLLRKIRGLTQMDLSELIGVSYQQVQKYETGRDNISVPRLQQIAKAMNVPMTRFFISDETVAESPAAYGKLADDEIKLLRLYRRIQSKKAKKAVLELLKNFPA